MRNLSATFSFIAIILSLIFFILPALLGNSVLIAFFFISLILLIVAFVTSINGMNDKDGKPSNLGLFSVIASIIFFFFLIIGALLA